MDKEEVFSRIIFILIPFQRVVSDVFTNAMQIIFVAYNVIKIIALPDRRAGCVAVLVDKFGCNRFELSNY